MAGQHPLTADLDIGLVQVPLACDGTLAPVEALQQLRREADDPAMHCGVIDAQAAFSHHLFQITQAEIVGRYQRTQSRITDWSK